MKIKFSSAVFLISLPFLIPFFAFSESHSVDNFLHVGAPGVKKIRLFIPNFDQKNTSSGELAQPIKSRLESMLAFTNWFELTTDANNAEFILAGNISGSKKNADLNLKLINAKTKAVLTNDTYKNLTEKTFDLPLKKFGDEFIKSLTGIPGPFMSRLAFVGRDMHHKKESQIYISDFDGTNTVQITNNKSINTSPSWSPDGTKLTYTSFSTGYSEIYEYDLKTKETRALTKKNGSTSGACWSADGKQIAFSTSIGNGKTHIFSIPTQFSKNKIPVAAPLIAKDDIEVEPAFSPDGRYLAYTSNRFAKPMLFLKDLKGNAPDRRLTFSGWYNASPSWDPNSAIIAFASYDKEIDRWDLFKINVNGEGLERMTLKQGDNEKPTWSPDGRFIVFQSTRGPDNVDSVKLPHQLFVMSKDGDFQHILNTGLYDVRLPTWSPRLSN